MPAVAHAAGVPLIVDAAWAAHLGFHPDLPPHAIAAGADAMVTSAHKALPAYTQGALVLARTERLDPARLDRAFEATHTTSPTGSIMASIDAARALLAAHGERLCGRLIRGVAAARKRLREVPGLDVLDGPGVEPTKLVVLLAGTGAHGNRVEADIIAAGMPVEMADRDTVDPDPDDRRRRGADRRLHRGADRVDRAAPRLRRARCGPRPRGRSSRRRCWRRGRRSSRRTRPCRRRAAIGRVSAELIAPYPPGVPVLAPGELITAAAVEALREVAGRRRPDRLRGRSEPADVPGHRPLTGSELPPLFAAATRLCTSLYPRSAMSCWPRLFPGRTLLPEVRKQ